MENAAFGRKSLNLIFACSSKGTLIGHAVSKRIAAQWKAGQPQPLNFYVYCTIEVNRIDMPFIQRKTTLFWKPLHLTVWCIRASMWDSLAERLGTIRHQVTFYPQIVSAMVVPIFMPCVIIFHYKYLHSFLIFSATRNSSLSTVGAKLLPITRTAYWNCWATSAGKVSTRG